MRKLAKIILSSISYQGDNIGDNLKFEINLNDRKTIFGKKLIYKLNNILSKTLLDVFIENDVSSHLSIKVTEEDEVFDDVGEINNEVFDINFAGMNSIKHCEVKVQERKLIKKRVAIFNFEFEVRIIESKSFIAETEDGWLEVQIEGISDTQSLPAFLSVKYETTKNKRDYFTILEGVYKNRKASVALKKDGSSHLKEDYLDYEQPARTIYSISKKIFTINNKHFNATDYPDAPWQKGVYNLEIPDHPHFFRKYGESKFYKVWFRIGHPDGERYLHTGRASLGCLTIIETMKWDEIYNSIIKSRKGDGLNVGTLEVID